MNDVPTGGRRIAIRFVGAAILAFVAFWAVRTYSTGKLEFGGERHWFVVSGGDLWTGYLTLMATAALGVLLFFTDQMQARLFRVLSNVAGVTWFIAMLLLFIHCKPLDT